MTFHDVLFPLDIALNSEGGPTRRTEIVALDNGREERNSPWSASRRSYNAGYGVKSLADVERVVAFFEARRARLYAFRFRDPFDHRSCAAGEDVTATDQLLGVGDGARRDFPLVKTYASGPSSYARAVTKPVAGSVLVALDGVVANESAYGLDLLTGVVTFAAAPPAGVAVTAGFLFDVPARFDTDSLRINLAAFAAGDIPQIPLIEALE